jgi:hypothetical protein
MRHDRHYTLSAASAPGCRTVTPPPDFGRITKHYRDSPKNLAFREASFVCRTALNLREGADFRFFGSSPHHKTNRVLGKALYYEFNLIH